MNAERLPAKNEESANRTPSPERGCFSNHTSSARSAPPALRTYYVTGALLHKKQQTHSPSLVLSRLWVCGRAGGLDIPCPPGFLLATKMNVTVGHKAHVFVSHVHFCGSYPDGGTLGYQAHRHGPTPKAEKEPKGSGKSKSVRSDAAAGYYTDFLKPAEKHETVDNSCF